MTSRAHGMSLVELMLALLLGSLVAATAIGIFIANQNTMMMSQGLGRIQQNMQIALELLSRDLRQAGGNPCSQSIPLANMMVAPASHWWTNLVSSQKPDGTWSAPWSNSLRGLTTAEFPAGTGERERVAGSDAIELLSADTNAVTVVSDDGTTLLLNTKAHGFSSGNLLLVCEPRQASLFQGMVSGANITHPAGGMNCSGHLGMPGGCNGEPFIYSPHALMARWNPVRWYLGVNPRGGTSLYHITLDGNGQGVTRQEMVEDVSALKFRYLLAGASEYVPLSALGGNWAGVIGVRIELEVTAAGIKDDAGNELTRTAVHTVSLRSRNP